VSEWTEEEFRDQLCWCLDGKASEYYALLVERNHNMAYKDLILKIKKRFGFREQHRYNLIMRTRFRRNSWRTGRIESCPWLLEPLGIYQRTTCTNKRY
jgi:hypothetical protein